MNDPWISVDFSDSSHHTFHIHSHIWQYCCRSLAPPVLLGSILLFQAAETGPVTDGFLLYRGRPGGGHHYPHRWDQEHEGEQDSPTSGRLHPQTPISWPTHAAPTVPHLAQRPMRPTH